MPKCAILLSTYNGEKYLRQQLKSLERQTVGDWDLIVRDDGSKDDTVKILQAYIRKTQHKVIFVRDGLSLGAARSFLYLLEVVEKDNYQYVFFCDQDDIWYKGKLELSIEKIDRVATDHQPILVHTDLKVVDENLNPIYSSMWKARNTNPLNNKINNYLTENNVTGCTIALNKDAVELIVKINHFINKNNIVMHDWWSSLIISIFGKVIFIDQVLVAYRQHENNTIGLNKKGLFSILTDKYIMDKNSVLNNAIRQAQEIRKYLEKSKYREEKLKNMINDYSMILYQSPLQRLKVLNKYRLRKTGILKDLGFKLIMILKKRRK